MRHHACLLSFLLLLSTALAADSPMKTSDGPFTETVVAPEGAAGLTTWLQCGPAGLTVTITTQTGPPVKLTLRPFAAILPAVGGAEPVSLPEAGIELVELKLRRYVRPNPLRLKGPAKERVLKDWNTLPSPLTHRFPLTLRQASGGIECYLDGQYAGTVARAATLKAITFSIPPGSALGASEPVAQDGFWFLPLDLRPHNRPAAKMTVDLSARQPAVPLSSPGAADLDLGVTARQQETYADYTYRSGYDGLRESYLFSVPSAQYTRAWVLCALDDSAEKDPAFTARLTRFVSGGPYTGRARDCLADTTITLPREGQPLPANVRRAGSTTLGEKRLPLYLVEVPLASGDIQDLIFNERTPQRGAAPIASYLDFELLGRLRPQDRPHPFGDGRYLPDSSFPSGVHVLALTLEATPVEMEVRQTQPGNIFCGEEKREVMVALRPQRPGEYELRWRMTDVTGKPCGTGKQPLSCAAPGGEQIVPVSLRQPQPGWYGVVCELWEADRLLLTHHAAFALLPPDTRQAGYESPYASWWFDHHYGTSDPKIAGPLLLKAGFRRAAYAVGRHNEQELAPWKVTAAAVSWGGISNYKATDEEIEVAIRKTVEAYPHCDNILIFHESMPGAPLGTRSAPELFGLPVQEYSGADDRWAHATRVANIVRAKFPQLKIFIGNSGASSELIAEGLRRKFPKELADYVGIETVGRTGHPEKLWEGGLPGVWLMREVGRKLGTPWPVTSCYETNYRQERLLGDQRHAEWYVRDLLLSHAYRLPYISLGLLYDAGNSYHASFWGSTGLCRRFPLLYPKPAYVAVATATRVLDRVTLRGELPTGSNCVYALDFARADGKTVCALWTARGTCDLSLTLQASPRAEIVDLYGKSRFVAGNNLKLTAGTAVQYLITPGRVAGVKCGSRTYPEDQPPANFRVADAMSDPARWQLVTDQDPLLEQTSRPHLPFRTAGKFALRGVPADKAVEVELLPRKDLPTPLLNQYAVLRLKNPVTLPGEPTTLGVFVKGNSGWGQVYWEIEDAAGVRRISCGTVVHDADVFDYDGRVSVNFDGWAFLSFPITNKSAIPDLSTGSVENLWEATNRSKPVTYPIKLTGVALSVPQETLHLTEMKPMKQILRFRDVGAWE